MERSGTLHTPGKYLAEMKKFNYFVFRDSKLVRHKNLPSEVSAGAGARGKRKK